MRNFRASNLSGISRGSSNVGIGTTTPTGKVHVYGSVNGEVGIRNDNVNPGNAAYSIFRQSTDTGTFVLFTNSSTRTADGGAGNTTLRTDTGNLHLSAGGGKKVSITTAGNVGIGTTAPASKLDVNGTVTATGPAGQDFMMT